MELTKKQKGFADDYIDSGNATEAALNNYDIESEDKENVAGAIGSENLRKPNIKAYIEENADGAASRIVELSKSATNETVKLNANKDILDRAGFKPVDKTDITTAGEKVGVIILPQKNELECSTETGESVGKTGG